jgi:hypothetical protein
MGDLVSANVSNAPKELKDRARRDIAVARNAYHAARARLLEALEHERRLSGPLSATFVSFPWAPPGADEEWWRHAEEVAISLGLTPVYALDGTGDWLVLMREILPRHEPLPEDFAVEVLRSEVVPVEESPLSGVSLAQLLERAPSAAGAAVAAWGTGPNDPLLLLITVPVGMIVFGAATGVSKALNTGLRAKILGWMGVADPLQPRPPATLTPSPDEDD